jgi:OOP family OmpA-OmpF porin
MGMKRVIIGGLLAATAAAGGNVLAAGTGAPGDDTGAWYVSPMAQYDVLDKGRVARDDLRYQIGVGKNFSPNWSGEFNYENGEFKIPNSGMSQRLSGYSFDALYKFLPGSIFRPYLVAGGGMLDDVIGGGEKKHMVMTEAGAGLLAGIGSQTGSTRLQLRAEAKYRLEFANRGPYGPKDPGDLLLGVGLQLMFGAPTPPPPQPPPPVEQPPPPTPPPPPPPPAPFGTPGH